MGEAKYMVGRPAGRTDFSKKRAAPDPSSRPAGHLAEPDRNYLGQLFLGAVGCRQIRVAKTKAKTNGKY